MLSTITELTGQTRALKVMAEKGMTVQMKSIFLLYLYGESVMNLL